MLMYAWNDSFCVIIYCKETALHYKYTHSIVLLSFWELSITQLSQLNAQHLQLNLTLNVTLELKTIKKPFKDVRTKCQLSNAMLYFGGFFLVSF